MRNVCSPDKENILIDAIKLAKPIVLTTKTKIGWNLYRSEFKSSNLPQNIICKSPEMRFGLEKISYGKVGVSFRLGTQKVLFHSNYLGNKLTWPNKMAILQRRCYERTTPRRRITVRFWKFNEDNRTVYYGELIDISAGGMKVSVGKPCEMVCHTCAIEADKFLLVDAIPRSSQQDDKRTIVSFQFVGLEFDDEGQKKLQCLSRLIKQYRFT